MLRIVLPIVAFIAVLAGLVATEAPPTEEELEQQARREMLSQIQAEQQELLSELDRLERERQMLNTKIAAIERSIAGASANTPALEASLERLRVENEAEKADAIAQIAATNEKMEAVEEKAENWVRMAYNLTPDALPPGYLARVLWRADGAAIAESGKLARDLRATLHISETAAQAAATRVGRVLKSGYARRTLVTAAASLATLALIESAEPVVGWTFERWWKLLAAVLAALVAYTTVVQLQKRQILD
jgi:hypothetical protein